MKNALVLFLMTLTLVSCDPKDLQRVLDTVGSGTLSNLDISNGLKEALQFWRR